MSSVNDLLIRALKGESLPRPPIWLMRQAGRTDPEYNRLKEASGLPLEDLFRHPEFAAQVSLLPRRLGVDAIIFFQDILTLLGPMGSPFVFRPGPMTETPIRDIQAVRRLKPYDVRAELPFISETFERIDQELRGELPVLGFCGAPLTLLVFLAEGKSFGSSADQAIAFLDEQPEAAHELLDLLTQVSIDYLRLQAKCGVAAVQIFESAAFLLSPAQYAEFALPYQQRIIQAIRDEVPTIIFARGWSDVRDLAASGAQVLSLDSSVTIKETRALLGENTIVQGNLDNRLLVDGPLHEIERAAKACVDDGERRGHIFNLNHGLLRETPYEHVKHLVKIVREY